MSDKNNEKLTEQQKENRRNYTPEPWVGICPSCKRFHRGADYCVTDCERVDSVDSEWEKAKDEFLRRMGIRK